MAWVLNKSPRPSASEGRPYTAVLAVVKTLLTMSGKEMSLGRRPNE